MDGAPQTISTNRPRDCRKTTHVTAAREKKKMSTRPEPRVPPVDTLPLDTWARRSYAGALAMELWRDNRLQGHRARSAAIASRTALLPPLPAELWIDVCQWLIETEAVTRIDRYINRHIPSILQRLTVTMDEIHGNADAGHFYQDPETGEIPEAVQIRDYELNRVYGRLMNELECSMDRLYQGSYLFHYARDAYLDLVETIVSAHTIE